MYLYVPVGPCETSLLRVFRQKYWEKWKLLDYFFFVEALVETRQNFSNDVQNGSNAHNATTRSFFLQIFTFLRERLALHVNRGIQVVKRLCAAHVH